jgi:peptide methionine sulfoxide reductase MsrA
MSRVGEGELKRRAYGEANFGLVMKKLRQQLQHSKITNDDIHKRIDALAEFIPSEAQKQQKLENEVQEILANISFLKDQLGQNNE